VDIKGTGAIEFSDFMMANMNMENLKNVEVLKRAFNEFDTDHDGYITLGDLRRLFKMDC